VRRNNCVAFTGRFAPRIVLRQPFDDDVLFRFMSSTE
jgi:hypothetical protein